MALIKCPECGREISDKAATCPSCGCPIAEESTSNMVKIKLPKTEDIVDGFVGLLSSKDVSITGDWRTLWSGKHGETASFTVDKPTEITINLGKWGNPVNATVKPRHSYELVRDFGIHLKTTFRLSEVDTIDSGL